MRWPVRASGGCQACASILPERIYQAYEPIAARQGVELKLALAQAAPAILVDEGRRMHRVLKNLVENVLLYTSHGGEIELSTAGNGEKVEIRVRDSRSGIDPEDLPYVFDRFHRADKACGSSGKMGPGLAICKALVSAQAGTITADSAGRERGTTMILAFNVAGKEREAAIQPQGSPR